MNGQMDGDKQKRHTHTHTEKEKPPGSASYLTYKNIKYLQILPGMNALTNNMAILHIH